MSVVPLREARQTVSRLLTAIGTMPDDLPRDTEGWNKGIRPDGESPPPIKPTSYCPASLEEAIRLATSGEYGLHTQELRDAEIDRRFGKGAASLLRKIISDRLEPVRQAFKEVRDLAETAHAQLSEAGVSVGELEKRLDKQEVLMQAALRRLDQLERRPSYPRLFEGHG